ncbi:calcium-binding protein [Microvirga guangxiensis]|uniref:Ca2+-binding protein, RTX toxin-related n=1 Tax=Microvirga guangxiensis TaxID=549386 RepID=A0A1G5K4E2_9HYPH|nr:calcium-binding protein [Microvirga guangxiensis]SCY95101.1 Ca2+-binding protein, RTX toxin-related [Microvirga guangxiensis]
MASYNEALRLFVFDKDETAEFVMSPGMGNCSVLGNSLGNRITGNDGDNSLDGGEGADFLMGNDGNDTYIVDDVGDVVYECPDEGFDTIKASVDVNLNFHGFYTERLILTGGASSGIGNGLNNEIIGNNNLVNFLDGGGGDDILRGGTQRDQLIGGKGNDCLDGGGGSDQLVGGEGDDTYVVHSGHETILETAGQGWDQVNAWTSYTLKSNLEALKLLGDSNISGTGNSANNSLTGNNGRNNLQGLEGNDTLDGGAGEDRLEGGTGNDTYYVDDKDDVVIEDLTSDGNDTVYTSIDYTLSEFVENLIAHGSGAIRLTGNELANTITGNDQANIIDGGAGADRMDGGGGNDIYYVDNVRDVITDVAGFDTVKTTCHYTLNGTLENLTAASGSNALKLTGNALNNGINGNRGRDTLKGLGGNDTLNGKQGSDILYGGKGQDTFVFDTHLSAGNIDKICDFNFRQDTIHLDNAIFRKLGGGSINKPGKLKKAFFTVGKEAKDGNDYIVYDKEKGALYYDYDGSGQGAAVLFARFKAGTIIKADDLMII